MRPVQRFARAFLAVRELDFLVVGVSLVVTLLAYQWLPALGGLVGRFPALASTSPLSVLGLVLMLAFFGLPILAGAVAALRPGELRGLPLRLAVGSTLFVQSIVSLFAATLAFSYAAFLLAYPEVALFFDLPHSAPWELHVQRAVALVALGRVALTVGLLVLHRGPPYSAGDTSRSEAIVCVLVVVIVIVAARLLGSLASFALVDAWVAAGIASAFFRGPGHEG